MRGCNYATSRTRQYGMDRLGQRGFDRHQPASRLHHHDRLVAANAESAGGIMQLSGKRAEIARHQRTEEGIHYDGAGALELSKFAEDLRGDANSDTGQMAFEHGLGDALVQRIGVGVQKYHGDGFDPVALQIGGRLIQLWPRRGLNLLPSRVNAPAATV